MAWHHQIQDTLVILIHQRTHLFAKYGLSSAFLRVTKIVVDGK